MKNVLLFYFKSLIRRWPYIGSGIPEKAYPVSRSKKAPDPGSRIRIRNTSYKFFKMDLLFSQRFAVCIQDLGLAKKVVVQGNSKGNGAAGGGYRGSLLSFWL
jgi:hypothetical protein